MNFNNLNSLKTKGFKGFQTIENLWHDSTTIPDNKGVYLVLAPELKNPIFLNTGVGGFFKGENPKITIDQLEDNWVVGSRVIYIGKAGSRRGDATLRSRIKQYLRFGQGKNVGLHSS